MNNQSPQKPPTPSAMSKVFLIYLSEMLYKHSQKSDRHAWFAVICMSFAALFASLLVGLSLVLLALYDAAHLFAGDWVHRLKQHIRRDRTGQGE